MGWASALPPRAYAYTRTGSCSRSFPPRAGKAALELVKDFLLHFKLDYTLSVLEAEASLVGECCVRLCVRGGRGGSEVCLVCNNGGDKV